MVTWEIEYRTSTGAVVVIDVQAEHRHDSSGFVSLYGTLPGSSARSISEVWRGRTDHLVRISEVEVVGLHGRRRGEGTSAWLERTSANEASLQMALDRLEDVEVGDGSVQPGQEYPVISPESIQIGYYLDIAKNQLAAARAIQALEL